MGGFRPPYPSTMVTAAHGLRRGGDSSGAPEIDADQSGDALALRAGRFVRCRAWETRHGVYERQPEKDASGLSDSPESSGRVGERQPFEAVKMEVRRSELAFDHCRALEIVSDRQFLRDADAAMRLDRILADEFG